MKERAILELQKKYEYLDFNDTVVLSCLNDAIRYMETVCPDTLSNKNIAMMEIEYHFLHYLVLEMKKGNKEIYDAVSIGLEPTFDFFKRKRRDLVTGIDKEEEKMLYDIAFKNMIDSYTERQSLSSLFIKNLISTFKMKIDKTGDVILMKYVIKENSLFKTFDNYSKEIVEFVINTFKNEVSTTSLLVRQFGPNFDGLNAKKDLAYYEKMRLEPVLTRFEQRLEYVKLMETSGKTLKEVKNTLKGKKDYEIDKIVASYKKTDEKVIIFKSLNQIRQSLNVNDKVLDELLYSLPSSDIKLVFKYTYGIGVKKLEDYQIMDMLRIDQKKYNEYLKTACSEVSKLVKIKKAEKSKREKVKVAVKPVIKPAEVKSKSESIKTVETKKSDKRQQYTYFTERFYSENATELEKQEIDKKVYEIFYALTAYENGKKVARKLYGDGLNNPATTTLDRKESSAFTNLVAKIKNELSSKEKKQTGRSRKKKFIEYLYTDNMTMEEKKALEVLLMERLDILQKKSPKAFALAQKLYGEKLNQELSDYKIERNKAAMFTNFIFSTKTLLSKKDIDILKKESIKFQKETKTNSLKNNFYENFYTENMTEEEKESVRDKVRKALLFHQNTKSYEILYRIYDENLNLIIGKEVTRIEKTTITRFVNSIFKVMNLDLDLWLKHVKRVSECEYFFEYFYTESMTLEEKQNLKEEILKIIECLKLTNIETYKSAAILYGESLTERRKDIELNPTEKANFGTFISRVRRQIGKEIQDVKNNYVTYPRRPKKFNMYLYKYGMTEEEKQQQDKLVEEILKNQQDSTLKGYKVAQKLYGEYLDRELISVEMTPTENSSFGNFVNKIKDILDGKKEMDHNLKYKRSNSKKETFFNYFYDENMSDEEKEDIKNRVIQFVKNSNLNGIQVAYKLYGPNLDTLNDVKLDSTESANISWLRKEIRSYLLGKEKRKYHRITKNKVPTFFEHFYTENMSDKEKIVIKNQVLIFMNKSSLAGVLAAYKLYGDDLSIFNGNVELTKNENANLAWLKSQIRKYLEQNKGIMDEIKPLEIEESIVDNVIEETQFPDIDPIEEELTQEIEEMTEDNVEEISITDFKEKQINNSKVEVEKINYLDSIILKAYDCFQDHDLILSKLKISESVLIDCYIRHLSHFNDLDEILDYIIETDSNSISKILSSEYFSSFGKYLTEKEQEVIYLLLLSKQNKKIDTSMISMITGVDVETLNNYKVMTPDDELNKLYEYIKR